MRKIRLDLAYDGSAYAGWQLQSREPTVQGAIEQVLSKLLGGVPPPRLHAAGRTDAGVHALGQVAHFQTENALPIGVIQRGLNATLPRDIVVVGASEAAPTFDARRSALSRRYRYRILNREMPDPFERSRAWHIRGSLAEEKMAEAASHLVGTHDFSSFRASGCDSNHPVRTVTSLTLERTGDIVAVEIESKAFLRHMVRSIVGTLVEVALGRMAAEEVAKVLGRLDRRAAGPTAPAHGLYLVRITYPYDS